MASTEQSLPQAPQASMGINPSVSPQSQQAHLASEPLVCQWQGCQQPNHPSPEALYEHVCENHIGRKSTNNLNLQCFWGSCRTTTVKRDHITSHIRVHVPLKPHKCDFCQKSFKRPQDLKKHVKTHADESVLFNSPQQSVPGSRQAPNGYQIPGNGRPDGSYGEAQGGHPHMGYPYGNGQGAFQGGNGMPGQGFGYPYNVPQTSSYGNDNGGLTESRKRAHDTLNEFFGDVKRRNIDAGQYQDLGARFSAFLQMFALFAAGGWNGGYNPGFAGGPGGNVGAGFDGGNGGQYQTQAAPPMANYTPPFPELRTKNDLMSIDQFLEQLQNTVYDNEGAATSGAFNPIAGMQHQGINFPRRPSNSPPRFQGVKGAAATPGSYSSTSFAASSTLDDAPSFGSGGSPQHAQAPERPQGGSLYPTLPSFHSLDNPNAFASASNGSMPPSSLGPQYEDFDGRRRFSGGLLQRAQPPTSDVEARAESMLRAEAAKDEAKSANSGEQEPKGEQQDIKLPSVSEIERENEQQDKQEDRKESEEKMDSGRESWENNMRTIATMRDYVRARLQRGEFDGSEDGNRTPRAELPDVDMKDVEEEQATTPKREGASLYPVLRPVEV